MTMAGYDIIGFVLLVAAAVHIIALGAFIKAYLQGRLMSVGFGMGFGGPKYITPFVTRFVKE